jgi:hypothetical protein
MARPPRRMWRWRWGDGFAGVGAVVDDEAVAVFVEAEFAGDMAALRRRVAVVFRCCFVDAGDGFARDDEDVCRRGGADVAKGED